MVAKVRQRAFRILLPTDTERELFTENIITPCTGVAGTDGKGAGFLCHFDGKRSTLALDEIFKILKQNGVDLKSLKALSRANFRILRRPLQQAAAAGHWHRSAGTAQCLIINV